MLIGEIAPGGVGTGLYGILVLAVIAVFVGGLLVGRTPEYLGKKLRRREITLAALSILVMPALVLIGTGIAIIPALDPGFPGQRRRSRHPRLDPWVLRGALRVRVAANNNGSAFAGLTVTSDWFQSSLGLCMLFGRLLPILFVLALAGFAGPDSNPIRQVRAPCRPRAGCSPACSPAPRYWSRR